METRDSRATPAGEGQDAPAWLRALPLALLAAAVVWALFEGVWRDLSFSNLQDHREQLRALVQAHPAVSLLCFIALYAAVTSLSIPGAFVLMMAGGLLFGAPRATVGVTLGATAGATLVFLAVRLAAGDFVRRRVRGRLQRFEQGFRRDDFVYLLSLRLAPIAPFWLVNLAAAVLGARLRAYVAATFLGVIPTAAIYTSLGSTLEQVLRSGEDPHLSLVFEPQVLFPLLGLALLSLAPMGWRLWRRRLAR